MGRDKRRPKEEDEVNFSDCSSHCRQILFSHPCVAHIWHFVWTAQIYFYFVPESTQTTLYELLNLIPIWGFVVTSVWTIVSSDFMSLRWDRRHCPVTAGETWGGATKTCKYWRKQRGGQLWRCCSVETTRLSEFSLCLGLPSSPLILSPPLLSSPLLSTPLLSSPSVLCWELHSRICFAAVHQISVDFPAVRLQFLRVDELLRLFIRGTFTLCCSAAPQFVTCHLRWNKNRWRLKWDFMAGHYWDQWWFPV